MKFLNNDGVRTILNKIKDKFATKQELQELAKKSSGKLVPSNDGGIVDLSDYVKKEELQEQLKNVKVGNVRLVDKYPDNPEENVLYFIPPEIISRGFGYGDNHKIKAYISHIPSKDKHERYLQYFF